MARRAIVVRQLHIRSDDSTSSELAVRRSDNHYERQIASSELELSSFCGQSVRSSQGCGGESLFPCEE